MSIKRGPRPETGWYTLDKKISEDGRLSWAARGLLIFLLGKPDHWEVSVSHLTKQTTNARIYTGSGGVYAMLGELQSAGYVTMTRVRRPNGTLAEANYVINDQPVPPKPDQAEPDQANTTLVSNERAVKTENTPKAPASPAVRGDADEQSFERWWSLYPSSARAAKDKCLSRWKKKKLTEIESTLVNDVKERVAKDDRWKRGFIPMPYTYLNQDRWDSEIAQAPTPTNGRPPEVRHYETPEETKVNLAAAKAKKPLSAEETGKRLAEARAMMGRG